MAKRKKSSSSLTLGTGMGLGFFEEFVLKKVEAEERLARTFAAFVKMPLGGYFICGGNVPPTYFSNGNFRCVIIGHSLVEIDQGESLLRKVGSRINSLFTERDFHSTTAMDFLSKYLRANIQNMRIPQALAVEFMIWDIRDNLLKIRFDGDIEADNLGETDEEIFVVGCYDENLKQKIITELKKTPKNSDKEQMVQLAKKLSDKFKLPHLGFVF